MEASEWIGADLEEVFESVVEGVGKGSINGETKRRIVTTVEKIKFSSSQNH